MNQDAIAWSEECCGKRSTERCNDRGGTDVGRLYQAETS